MASRRDDMLAAALHLFGQRGYEGTSISDLAEVTGLSKAAFSYHFASKEEILMELAEPLVADLERVVEQHEGAGGPKDLESVLGDSIDALLRHRDVAVWIDADKSVLRHAEMGSRLDRVNAALRAVITGGETDPAAEIRASAVLGAIWRPVRNLTDMDVSLHRSVILTAAVELAGGHAGERAAE